MDEFVQRVMQSREGKNNTGEKDTHAEAWLGRYQDRLDRALRTDTATLDDVIDVLWEEGVFGRIAPASADEKTARAERGKGISPSEINPMDFTEPENQDK